ncbi:S9 family peptidase [Chitinimonas sp. BJYL2]|uniref:S9 family peptidase n=1 Tax=Chitinimonas sp. BJYL2 TaxID=2976696 RepID=UPI0022B4C86A|nr:S9 family peptidase [Chitinimonas sp. BJYL2]
MFPSRFIQCVPAALIAGLLLLAAPATLADTANTITAEQLFSRAQYGSPSLSPDGKQMSVLTPINGRLALAVIDLKTREARVLASSKVWDAAGVRWINNKRVLFSVQDTRDVMEKAKGDGPFAINIDGTGFRDLSEKMRVRVLATLKDGSDDILVTSNKRSPDAGRDDFGSSDVYRMDTKSGKAKLLTFTNPGKVNNWIVDEQGQVRAAVSFFGDKASGRFKTVVNYRDNQDAPWKVISEFLMDDEGYVPVGFDADGKTMYVTGRGKEDKEGLYIWDFATNKPKSLVFRHPEADFGDDLIRDWDSGKVVGVFINAYKPEAHYFDESWAQLQANFNATFPNAFNSLQKRGDRILVTTTSDINPGQAFLYEPSTGKLEQLLSYKPELNPELLSPMKTVSYTARDGLEIPGYLTLPKGKDAKKLPLVAFVHGGPHARDDWGFSPMVQFLAAQGYAVLQPNFRMSTGLGWKLHRAGWKQWGLAMQDDITDGVNWLVKEGIVDPKRVCIMGASYGGYATMYGLVKDPDLYQCGINYVGVTDISMLFTVAWSDTSDSAWTRFRQKDLHGDPDKDVDYMKKSSALENADRITKPVMMAYGSEDIRVPLIHGEKMRDKLKARGIPVEWIVYAGEGHGWSKPENNYDFAHRVGAFLKQHLDKPAK